MKEPLIIGNNLYYSNSGSVRQKQNSTQLFESNIKNDGSFNDLLTNKIESITKQDDLSYAAIPLDRKRLLQLIENIQTQMNNHLYEALYESDEDETFNGFQLDWMNLPGPDATQIEQIVPKIQHGSAKEKRTKIRAGIDQIVNFPKIQHDSPKEKITKTRAGIDQIVDRASKKYNVNSDLIKAVVRAESDFDVKCTSSKGAMGLMQLMPGTAKELGVKNPYDPEENIMAGTRYLKSLIDRYDGNIPLSLAAYNWGMGNVERHPDWLPKETRTYIARINKFLHMERSSLISADT